MSAPAFPQRADWNNQGGFQAQGQGPYGQQRPRGGGHAAPSHRPRQEPDEAQSTAPERAARPGFGLRGPRREHHYVAPETLASLSLPVGDDGVVIGVDPQNQPAVLSLLRPAPLDVVLVGSMWMAQVLALRTVAAGARVAVESARPPAWAQMAQSAGGGQQCVTVHDVRQLAPQGPSVSSPVLVVRDCGARPPRGQLAPAPWQTTLTLLPFMGPKAPQLLRRADLIGLQRLSPQEAEVARRILRLPAEVAATLPQLSDNTMLWCTRDHQQFVMTQPTEMETGLLGGPRRMD